MSESKHIVFLAGFMGSGKSTIGPRLARKLDYDFVDIDVVIEKSEGISIPDIFGKHGEKYFRGLERRTLKEIAEGDRNVVVALGGGTLTNEENRLLVQKEGILVYLKTDPAKILERVQRKNNRPMLLSPDGGRLTEEDLSLRVRSLLGEREKHYLEASIVISTSNLTVSESVEEIASKLSEESFGQGKGL